MSNDQRSAPFWMIVGILGLVLGVASQVSARPLKVFILAGQSNMQGHVNVSTFDSMAEDGCKGR